MEKISRTEAKAQGLQRFFTGEPCKHGHVAERYTSINVCVECNSQNSKSVYGEKRPSEGTNGRAIWDALDVLLASGVTPTASHVRQLASNMGWNAGNVSAELSSWRKFHNVKQRSDA